LALGVDRPVDWGSFNEKTLPEQLVMAGEYGEPAGGFGLIQ